MSTNMRWVLLSYALLALIGAFTTHHVLEGVMGMAGLDDPLSGVTSGLLSIGYVIGLVAGAAIFIVLLKHPRTTEFGLDVAKEIRKVTWPTIVETRAATLVVIIMVAIMGVILGLFDYIFSSLTGLIYS